MHGGKATGRSNTTRESNFENLRDLGMFFLCIIIHSSSEAIKTLYGSGNEGDWNTDNDKEDNS